MEKKLKVYAKVLNNYTGFSGKIKMRGGFLLYTIGDCIYSTGANFDDLIKNTVFLFGKK